jgi:hypothetical protein
MHPIVHGLMDLFDGFRGAYGTYSGHLASADGGPKLKGRAISIPKDVTPIQWEQHVAGDVGLGIIPIDQNSEVKFAAIDIDAYEPNTPQNVNKRVQQLKLPLVVCATKSGGAHVYLFMREFTDAGMVVKRMREFASILGQGNAEIFPKQTRIVPERGDIGQWINVPYFNAGSTTRYGLDHVGRILNAMDFITYAVSKRQSKEELAAISLKSEERITDGPPCLNHLTSIGLPEGTRNNVLFNLGVYARRSHPDDWEKYVEEYNADFCLPPLPTSEVLGVLKSLRKEKSFGYTCKQAPLCNFCNTPKCRQQKWGIGAGGTGLPKLGTLTKLLTDPVIWFLDVDGGGRLELATEDIQNQRKFQNRCIETLNIMPTMMKPEDWQEIVRGLLETVTVVEMPVELTPSGTLRQHLEDFCTGRAQAITRDEILNGKPFTDGGYHFFRMQDFMDYLDRRKFKLLDLSQIGMWFREWKAEKKFMNLRGRGTMITFIPVFKSKQTEKFENPVSVTPPPFV